MIIRKETLSFLSELKENNDRPWFKANKDRFDVAYQNMKDFLTDLTVEMNQVDQIEKNKLFRIYRDVRFSKDKTPYNTHYSMSMSRQKPYLRGGYYLRFQPGNTMLACGFWNPNSHDMNLIRQNIARDQDAFRKALFAPSVKKTFTLEGEQVKSAPKGFSKDHPAIDLLRYKQFILTKKYSNDEVLADDFTKDVVNTFSSVRPFFDYMSDILGHDLDGVPLY